MQIFYLHLKYNDKRVYTYLIQVVNRRENFSHNELFFCRNTIALLLEF